MSFVDRHEKLLRKPRFWILLYLMFLLLSPIVYMFGEILHGDSYVYGGASFGDAMRGYFGNWAMSNYFVSLIFSPIYFPLGILGFIGLIFGAIPVKNPNHSLIYVVTYWAVFILLVLLIRKCSRQALAKLTLLLFLIGLLTLIGCSNIHVSM